MFGAVWLAGPILLLVGILLALVFGNFGIVLGLVGQAMTKSAAAIWAFLRPEVQIKRIPNWWRFAAAAFWSVAAIAVGQGIWS